MTLGIPHQDPRTEDTTSAIWNRWTPRLSGLRQFVSTSAEPALRERRANLEFAVQPSNLADVPQHTDRVFDEIDL